MAAATAYLLGEFAGVPFWVRRPHRGAGRRLRERVYLVDMLRIVDHRPTPQGGTVEAVLARLPAGHRPLSPSLRR